MVEHSAVNRVVVGSSPTRGAIAVATKGGVAKSSNQMIERYPCSISTNKKSSVFLFQENLLDFGVL